jgi:TolB-like protein
MRCSSQQIFLTFWLTFIFTVPLTAQIRVAIGEFENQSNAFYLDQWERTLPDLLQAKLSKSSNIVVLERRKLKAVLEEKALALTGLMDSTDAQTIGNLLEAEYIIFGTIHHLDNQYRIDASIVKVSSGQIQSEKVVSPDQNHLSEMAELLGNNILFNLTGTGKYRNRIKLTRYPTKYFLAAAVGLGAATIVAQSQYNKYLDDYRNNDELEKFDRLYDKTNRTKKLSVGLATVTGTVLLGTIYCWIKNLSPTEIYAHNPGGKTTQPYLAINWKNEVKIGVQIRF